MVAQRSVRHGADAPPPQFPFVCLLVSGGHNLLLLVHGVGDYTQLGTTVDDALGAAVGSCIQRLRVPKPDTASSASPL